MKDAREKPGDEQDVLVEFSDEEGFGKYLDLHEAYNLFVNLKGVEHIDYLTFLSSFDRLFEVYTMCKLRLTFFYIIYNVLFKMYK